MANNPIPALFSGSESFMRNLPAEDEFMITGGTWFDGRRSQRNQNNE